MTIDAKYLAKKAKTHMFNKEWVEAKQAYALLLLTDSNNEEGLINYAALIYRDMPNLSLKILFKLENKKGISVYTMAKVGILYYKMGNGWRTKNMLKKVLLLTSDKAKACEIFKSVIRSHPWNDIIQQS